MPGKTGGQRGNAGMIFGPWKRSRSYLSTRPGKAFIHISGYLISIWLIFLRAKKSEIRLK